MAKTERKAKTINLPVSTIKKLEEMAKTEYRTASGLIMSMIEKKYREEYEEKKCIK